MDLIIIDNFLQFPVQVREWAVNQSFMDAQEFTKKYNEHTDWPGLRTQGILDLDPQYANIVFSHVANIIQRNVMLENLSMRSYFQITREQDGYSWIHQDNNVKYAALLYLNPNVNPKYGTTFYKCNDIKKWESFMFDQKGYETLKQINEVENQELYTELFTPTDTVANIFNRLVIYKGDIYHKSSGYFGKNIKDGRLTQVFFINGE